MLNNRGQSLVIFAIILPILLLFISYIFDVVTVNYEKKRLDNIAIQIEDNLDTLTNDEIVMIVSKNDDKVNVDIENEKIELSKKIKGIFNKITKQEYYEIKNVIEK